MKKLYFAIVALLLCAISASAATITSGTKLYLKTNNKWEGWTDYFAAYFYGDGDAWASAVFIEGNDTKGKLYEITVPGTGKKFTGVIFCRMGSSALNWDSRWTQTNDLTYDGKNNCYEITDENVDDGQKATGKWTLYTPPVVDVKAPQLSIDSSRFTESFMLTISAEEGAIIYYTLDGTDPTTSSNVYSTPIEISETTTVKALAVKGELKSPIKEATYTYVEYAEVTFFVNNQKGWTKLNFYCWEDGASTVSAAWPGTAMSKLNDVTGVNDPDWATWYCVTIANTPINRPLKWIFNDGSNQTNDSDPVIVKEYDTTPEDGYQVYLTLSSNGGSMTSVEGIEIENAPVEYFNLQGVRVANPENGLYIRRQGNKVEKIFLRK